PRSAFPPDLGARRLGRARIRSESLSSTVLVAIHSAESEDTVAFAEVNLIPSSTSTLETLIQAPAAPAIVVRIETGSAMMVRWRCADKRGERFGWKRLRD